MDVKLLNGIKSIYVNSLACVRVKGCESESFRVDSGVRQVCISDERGENGDGEEGSEVSRGLKRVETAWPLLCR